MSEELLRKADLSGLPEEGLAVVGLSGGADSTALACWLSERLLRERILLAHVNHMLRGEESERDEAAVREFARSTGLRLVVSRTDVGALAKERGLGLEECGRQVRYAFFHSLAPGENDRILTAHNAEDNAETVLLNLCRGAGLDGLCGIPRQRGKILRPFLRVSRRETEAYCREKGLSFVEDSTNRSPEFARNKVRLEVLPLLRELNPRVVEALGQTAELLTGDRDFLREEAGSLLARAARPYGLDVPTLLKAPGALRSAALKAWLEDAGCRNLEKKHLDLAERCLSEGGAAQLPGGVTVRRGAGLLFADRPRKSEPFSVTVRLPAPGETQTRTPLPGGKVLVLERREGPFKKSEQKIHNLYFKNLLDCAIITGTLTARTRREGDRFTPGGGSVSKSLKQVFRECGMPAGLRGSAVLLECRGKLAFCEGAGVSRDFRAAENTRQALAVTVTDAGE